MTDKALTVEFFFSFRSPYSYLAGPRAFALPEKYGIELIYRGIRPMVTRGVPLPMAKKLYILRDAAREARRLGMPFGGIYDPLGEGAIRCLYVAEYASREGKQKEFVLAASRAIWAEGVKVAGDRGLKRVADSVGLDWDKCLEAVSNEAIHQKIEENNQRLEAIGHWGVPTFRLEDKTYWGQDRIWLLEEELKRRTG